MTETIFTNGRIVTGDADFVGTVVVRDGRIVDVGPGCSHAGTVDLEGDTLIPGLIELHTDNMEKHFTPRPGVKWPSPLKADSSCRLPEPMPLITCVTAATIPSSRG